VLLSATSRAVSVTPWPCPVTQFTAVVCRGCDDPLVKYCFVVAGLPAACPLWCCSILIVPGFISRATVFDLLPPLLKEYGGASDVTVVSDARVQLMKFAMNGLAVDVVPAPINVATPPADADLDNVEIFDCVHADYRVTLNGIRTAVAFHRFFETLPFDAAVFSRALRAIKSWAKCMYNLAVSERGFRRC
jgi:poly(A) polymerase Pap1